jgi:hypothetical protein
MKGFIYMSEVNRQHRSRDLEVNVTGGAVGSRRSREDLSISP